MKYVLYQSSITNDDSAFENLRKHAANGEIVGEFFDDLSSPDNRPAQQKALQKCQDENAILLIMDLAVINNLKDSEKEGIQVKRLN